MDGQLLGNEFGRELANAFAIFLLIVAVLFAALIVWLIAVIRLVRAYRAAGVRGARRPKLIIMLAASTTVLAIGAVSMFFGREDDMSRPDDKQLVADAVAKVKSQFADPKGVQINEVWVGSRARAETVVCGFVDSDEITDTSRFMYTTNVAAPPVRMFNPQAAGGGRQGDWVNLEFPPRMADLRPSDAAYWEQVGEGNRWYIDQWIELCEKTRQGSDKSEDR